MQRRKGYRKGVSWEKLIDRLEGPESRISSDLVDPVLLFCYRIQVLSPRLPPPTKVEEVWGGVWITWERDRFFADYYVCTDGVSWSVKPMDTKMSLCGSRSLWGSPPKRFLSLINLLLEEDR